MRILILRGGALGDFLLTLPCIDLLRSRWPQAHVCLVGNATAAELARGPGELNEVCSQHEARWAALHGPPPLPAPLAAWLSTFDLVLNFWPDPDGDMATHFANRPPLGYLHAAARPESHPAARHFCEALAPLGFDLPAHFHHHLQNFPRLRATRSPTEAPWIALHPGSSSKARNWPVAHWLALSRVLSEAGARLLLILGEAETALSELPWPQDTEIALGRRLPELASRMADCDFYLGHDTGISHLAAALALPGIVLFGPSNPLIWAPQGPGLFPYKVEGALSSFSPAHFTTQLLKHPAFPENVRRNCLFNASSGSPAAS